MRAMINVELLCCILEGSRAGTPGREYPARLRVGPALPLRLSRAEEQASKIASCVNMDFIRSPIWVGWLV